jgi:hypothetical protein
MYDLMEILVYMYLFSERKTIDIFEVHHNVWVGKFQVTWHD